MSYFKFFFFKIVHAVPSRQWGGGGEERGGEEVKSPAVARRQNETNSSQRDLSAEWYKKQLSPMMIATLLSGSKII